MTYIGDEKRLEQLARKSRKLKYAPTGQIVPSLSWEDHLEIEAIQERQRKPTTHNIEGCVSQPDKHER